MYLSILIPSIQRHESLTHALCTELSRQMAELELRSNIDIEILIDPHEPPITTGQKRNGLLSKAKGDYVCFIDADDWVSPKYLKTLMVGINKNVDVVGLLGEMTVNGSNPEIFEHSLKYSAWKTNDLTIEGKPKYERNPNHLNCIRASIAKQIKFPEITFGEDHKWSIALQHYMIENNKKCTEYEVNEVIYYYRKTT